MSIMDLKKQRQNAIDAADAIVKSAESTNRKLTAEESRIVDGQLAIVQSLNPPDSEPRISEHHYQDVSNRSGTRGRAAQRRENEAADVYP